MPGTKLKPRRPRPAPSNGSTAEVLMLSEAAAYLRLPEADVLRLVEEQGLPARRLRNEWRFLLAAIRGWLSRGRTKSNKEAWMELAGAWKDDPYFDELLREIEKGRDWSTPEDPA